MKDTISMRELYNHPDIVSRRISLQEEINKNKFIIDKSVFIKTPEEKELLKKMKTEWKNKYQF